MKKLFISQPMKGKSPEEIQRECGNAIEIRQNPPNPDYSTQDQHAMLAYPILQSKIDRDKAAEALKQKLEEE